MCNMQERKVLQKQIDEIKAQINKPSAYARYKAWSRSTCLDEYIMGLATGMLVVYMLSFFNVLNLC